MSQQIKQHVSSLTKTIKLTDAEFGYINSLETVGTSFAFYIQQLKTNYLQTIAIAHGYKKDDELEISIDLKGLSHEMTVKKT